MEGGEAVNGQPVAGARSLWSQPSNPRKVIRRASVTICPVPQTTSNAPPPNTTSSTAMMAVMGNPRGLARGSVRLVLESPIMPCLTPLVAGRRPVPTITVAYSPVFSRQGGVSRAPLRQYRGAFENGRLKIAQGLPLAGALRGELREFQVRFTAKGRDSYAARSGEHDDLVMAVALAVWFAGGRLLAWATQGTPRAPGACTHKARIGW